MNIKQSIIEYKKRREAKKQARAEEYFEEIEKSKYLSNSYCPGCQFADNEYKDYCITKNSYYCYLSSLLLPCQNRFLRYAFPSPGKSQTHVQPFQWPPYVRCLRYLPRYSCEGAEFDRQVL